MVPVMKVEELSQEALERQLDRLLTFFPRIDAKVSALFAVTSAQIAIAALNLTLDDLKQWWVSGAAVVFGLCAVWVIVHLYRCAYPHLEGGRSSLVYFAQIADVREAEYIRGILTVTPAAYREDIAGQIWRNAEILCCKYRFLKRATIGASFGVLPWSVLLLATSLAHWTIPIISK